MSERRTDRARADLPAEGAKPLLPGWVDDHDLDPYGSRMLPRFGWPLRLFQRFFFAPIRDDVDLEPVRKAQKQGPIVYVMRTRSLLDYLYFNHFALKHDLPLARFANGLSTTLLAPLTSTVRSWWSRRKYRKEHGQRLPDPVDGGFLERLIGGGGNALVFLRRGREWPFVRDPGQRDAVEVLVEAQVNRDEPIFLVPQILVWERSPDRTNRGLIDVLLGDPDSPGRLRKLLFFLRYSRHAIVRVGEPVNLKKFIEQQEGQPVARVAKKLRWLLLGYLYREQKVIKGPDVRPRRFIFDRILAEPVVQREIEATAAREGRSRRAIEKRARKVLDRLGADFRWGMIMFMRTAIDVVARRIYAGVDFEPEDAERIRSAARRGTVVLTPSHRSHFDYLLVSWLMFWQGVMPPHIAAGANLSFFPMGPIFRRAGAFFIRRSFQGDPLYAILVDRYIRALIVEGYTQEFFLEGGRSRTGKMLPPKIGLLSYYVEAMADRAVPDVVLVPMYIAYEKVVEDYSRELSGGEKKKESAGELIKAGSVLRERFGRVYIKTNEPVSIKEALETLPRPWREMDRDERKVWLKRLATHVTAEIQDATVVTPSSVAGLVLLGHDQRGLTRELFLKRARFARQWLEGRGAHFSDAFGFPDDALNEALEIFATHKQVEILPNAAWGETTAEEGGFDIIAISQAPKARMGMDYNKNTILFHFVPAAFAITALVLGDRDVERLDRVKRRFAFLVDLFQEEFIFHPDLGCDVLLAAAGDMLQKHGVIEVLGGDDDDVARMVWGDDPGAAAREIDFEEAVTMGLDVQVRLADWTKASFFMATVRNFFEAYWIVLVGSRVLADDPLTEPDLVEASLEVGRRMWLTEDVTHPEAVHKVNLTNAVRHFSKMGVFVVVDGAGKDARLGLDEAMRERYIGPMRQLFESGRLAPAGSDVGWHGDE
jgi:glycerol-3-phosphate O-acyltransferase